MRHTVKKTYARPGGSPNKREALLALIPMGPLDTLVLNVIAAHVESILGMAAIITPHRPEPGDAYLAARRQYDAIKIIQHLAAAPQARRFVLAVIASDLCIPIMTYVYGESQLGGKAAVVSLYRLKPCDRHQFYDRVAKISLHEVGHMMGLAHCRFRGCLMRFSRQLACLDELPMRFCAACAYEIARRASVLNGE